MRPTTLGFVLLLGLSAGCATLGPTPAITGVSAIPAGRASGELQIGAMPGHFLSQAVVESPGGEPLPQGMVVIDPGRVLGDTGLVFGGRVVGPSHDTQVEPIIGVRRAFGARRLFSAAALVSGTHASASQDGASYEATRVAAELGVDVMLSTPGRVLELHLVGASSATVLDASGSYCIDSSGRYGVDCDASMEGLTSAETSGVFPAISAGIALHLLRGRDDFFHGARLLGVVATGTMPRVVGGEQESRHGYTSVGFALSLAFGARK